MSIKDRLAAGLNKIINRAGTSIRLRYFTTTIGSVYDDEVVLTQHGNDLWTSGIVLPINDKEGSYESNLVEQGKLINNDIKLFCHGSLLFTGSEMQFKLMVGSATTGLPEYTMIPDGVINHSVQNTQIYKKVYLRQIGCNGSLLGES